MVVLLDLMWSLASLDAGRISGAEKFHSAARKDVFDSIAQSAVLSVAITSGLPTTPDILSACRHVSKVPIAEVGGVLLLGAFRTQL